MASACEHTSVQVPDQVMQTLYVVFSQKPTFFAHTTRMLLRFHLAGLILMGAGFLQIMVSFIGVDFKEHYLFTENERCVCKVWSYVHF